MIAERLKSFIINNLIKNMEQENIKKEGCACVKKNKKYIIIGVVVVLFILFLGNNFVGRKMAEKRAENVLEKQLGGEVDINSYNNSISIEGDKGNYNVGGIVKWPSDMPSDIPEFSAGKLTMTSSTPTGWQVVASGVSKEDFAAYSLSLELKGWQKTGTFNTSLSMIQMHKENHDLIITLNPQDNNFTLTVLIKK